MSFARAERRRQEKMARQRSATPEAGQPARGPRYPFWLLSLSLMGFFFLAAGVAVEHALELWGPAWTWGQLSGWAGLGLVALLSFATWMRYRSYFSWQWRWALVIPVSLVGGVMMGGLWAMVVGGWTEQHQAKLLEQHYASLLDRTSHWTPTTHWNVQECGNAAQDQASLIKDVWRSTTPPGEHAVALSIATESVLYQAGCDNRWVELTHAMAQPPQAWNDHPALYARAQTWAKKIWPTMNQGCIWEALRQQALGHEMEGRLMSQSCRQILGGAAIHWKPGTFTRLAGLDEQAALGEDTDAAQDHHMSQSKH